MGRHTPAGKAYTENAGTPAEVTGPKLPVGTLLARASPTNNNY